MRSGAAVSNSGKTAQARRAGVAGAACDGLPELPLDSWHWEAIYLSLGLSEQQTRIVDLMLRDQSVKQIARIMGITAPTVKTYLQRIGARTGTRGRMQLAMHILGVSHEVKGYEKRRSMG